MSFQWAARSHPKQAMFLSIKEILRKDLPRDCRIAFVKPARIYQLGCLKYYPPNLATIANLSCFSFKLFPWTAGCHGNAAGHKLSRAIRLFGIQAALCPLCTGAPPPPPYTWLLKHRFNVTFKGRGTLHSVLSCSHLSEACKVENRVPLNVCRVLAPPRGCNPSMHKGRFSHLKF